MEKESKIYIAGHRGLVGSAIVSNLISKGYVNLIFKTHAELDLTNQPSLFDNFRFALFMESLQNVELGIKCILECQLY